jgi:hypothetical protein
MAASKRVLRAPPGIEVVLAFVVGGTTFAVVAVGPMLLEPVVLVAALGAACIAG